MKKRTLSMMVACLMGMTTYAQWTAPQQPTAASEFVSGHNYMVRNADSDGLYLAGAQTWYSWSTSLTLVENCYVSTPITYTISQETNEDGNTSWTFVNVATQKYTFISGLINVEEGSNLYAYNGLGEMHIDMWEQGHNYFDIIELDAANQLYRIKVVETDNLYGEQTGYWGFIKDDGTYPNAVYAFLDPSDSNNCCNWEFVDYTIYEALVTLYETLLEAAGYGVDTSSASAVYNNRSSTLDEIEAATDALSAVMNSILMGDASKDNPVDVTSLIENNDFSTGNISGWDCTFVSSTNATNTGYQSSSYTNSGSTYTNHEGVEVNPFLNKFIEAWSATGAQYGSQEVSRSLGDGEISQTLKDLPLGTYKLSCDLIAVNQDNASLTVSGAQLFAIGGDIDNYVEVSTANNTPEHCTLTFVSNGGNITIGLRTKNTNANWIAADNFELTYYGEFEGSPYAEILLGTVEDAKPYTDTDVYHYNTVVAEQLNEAIATAEALTDDSAATEEKLIAENEALQAVLATVKLSIQAYNDLASYMETLESDRDKYDAAGFDDISSTLADLYDTMQDHYEDCDLTNEEIQAYIDGYTDLLTGLLEEALQYATEDNPIDVTLLYLQNADFTDSSLDPWENTNGVLVYSSDTFPNGDCNVSEYNNYETFNHAIAGWVSSSTSLGDDDVHQTITGLPAGSYVLSCSMVAQHGTDMPSGVYLYTNGLVETTTECQHDEDLWNELVSAGTNNQLMMHPQHVFYHAGGDLTLGVRLESTNCNWVYASKFTLSYAGESINALYEAMMAMKEEALAIGDQVGLLIEAADDKLQNAINNAEALDSSASYDEIFEAYNILVDAITYANEGLTLISEIMEMAEIYNEKILTVDSDDSTFPALLNEINDAIAEEEFVSNEQMKEWIESLPKAWSTYIQYLFLDATIDNPADVTDYYVQNATLEGSQTNSTDISGWINTYGNMYYKSGDGRLLWDEENDCLTDEKGREGWWVENWAGSTCLKPTDIHQTIENLPEGYYTLTADCTASIDAYNGDETVNGVYLYAITNNAKYSTEVGHGFKGQSAGTNDKGDESYYSYPRRYSVPFQHLGGEATIGFGFEEGFTTWIVVDNFKLYYLGTGDENAPVAVDRIKAEENTTAIGIYDLAGRRISNPKKGIYIINGNKVLVK